MRRESLRRHGLADKVDGTKGYQLFRDSRADANAENKKENGLGESQNEDAARLRTQTEGSLESFKGTGAIDKYRKEREGV